MSGLANNLFVLASEIKAKREALDALLRRVNQAGVLSKIPTDIMHVIDPAYIKAPRTPKHVILAALAVLVGGGAFVGTPLLFHLLDQRIKAVTDVEKEFGTDLLGGIPKLSGISASDRPHVVRDTIDLAKVEPFLGIIAQLELLATNSAPNTFLVTSTVPGEGKSLIVSNLAAGFTRIGKRTLVIDADLRRPVQHEFHQIPNDRGLLAWASAGFPLKDIFNSNGLLGIQVLPDGTHLLPAGGRDPQPTRFLVSTYVATLYEQLRNSYDVLLIDTPLAGLFPDALVLARYAQSTLLVARETYAAAAHIRRTISDIDKTPAPVLGLILNAFSSLNLNPRLAYGASYAGYADYASAHVLKPASS